MNATTHALSINPASGETVGSYPYETAQQLDAALERATLAFRTWRRQPVSQRAELLLSLASALRDQAEDLAQMITLEMGKPIAQARAEIEKCAQLSEWYAAHGPAMLAPEPTRVDNGSAQIEYRPLGPIFAVMPWNFPVWQVLRGAVPTLLAGNTYVLKHAPNVMGSAYLIQQAFHTAGFAKGLFEVVNVTNDGVSQAIADPRIAAVTLTGSVRAGIAIGSQDGAALKKCVLELGGSDPFIVLNDADLDAAVQAAVVGRYQNSGQVCTNGTRVFIPTALKAAFEAKILERVARIRIGNPEDENTNFGPLVSFAHMESVLGYITKGKAEGARLLCGGERLTEGDLAKGAFVAPTVFTDCTDDMTIVKEEIFGPVMSILTYDSEEEVIRRANDTEFGLAAGVVTKDLNRAHRVIHQLEAGICWINAWGESDAKMPVGGYKQSGIGRENGISSLAQYTQVKSVQVELGDYVSVF